MPNPIAIRQLDHVVLRVTDFDRAIAFYRDVIGCAVEWRRDEMGLAHMRAGSSQIDIVGIDGELGRRGGPAAGEKGRNMDHFALTLAAFDEAAIRSHLEQHGVDCGEAVPRFGAEGNGPSLYITDPDGNTVELKGPATD